MSSSVSPPGQSSWTRTRPPDVAPSLHRHYSDFITVGSEEAPTKGLASVRRSNGTCGFPAYRFHKVAWGRENGRYNEWTFLAPVGIEPLRESPRPIASGSFTQGTYPRHRPYLLPSCLSPTTLPTDFPSPPGCRTMRSRDFHRACSVGSEEAPTKGLASVRRSNGTCGFPAYRFHKVAWGRENGRYNEWTFLAPVGIEPLRESPRPIASGSFTQGTYPRHRPYLLPSCLSPTTLPTDFPSPPGCRTMRSRDFHRACSTIRSSDSSHDVASHFAIRLIGLLTSVPTEDRARSPGVTCCSSVPCRLHTP